VLQGEPAKGRRGFAPPFFGRGLGASVFSCLGSRKRRGLSWVETTPCPAGTAGHPWPWRRRRRAFSLLFARRGPELGVRLKKCSGRACAKHESSQFASPSGRGGHDRRGWHPLTGMRTRACCILSCLHIAYCIAELDQLKPDVRLPCSSCSSSAEDLDLRESRADNPAPNTGFETWAKWPTTRVARALGTAPGHS
jgi:hypothetical protein